MEKRSCRQLLLKEDLVNGVQGIDRLFSECSSRDKNLRSHRGRTSLAGQRGARMPWQRWCAGTYVWRLSQRIPRLLQGSQNDRRTLSLRDDGHELTKSKARRAFSTQLL